MLFWPIFGNLWCPVVTVVTFSSNLSNFERNTKKPQKNPKKSKESLKKKKIQKSKRGSVEKPRGRSLRGFAAKGLPEENHEGALTLPRITADNPGTAQRIFNSCSHYQNQVVYTGE